MPIWTEERLSQRNFQGQDSQEIKKFCHPWSQCSSLKLVDVLCTEVLEQHHVHDFGKVSSLCLLCKEGNT
jgi:hypothetical protein